jgi:hypothetical protein
MATVYSLVCFGGQAGKTATMTIANPCVVTLTTHGLRDGTGVVFTTTGALPTGVTSGTTYYSRSTAANTFNLYDTSAHAIAGGTTGRVTTSGSQSGTHTIKGAYWNGLTADQKLRYGTAGSERAYAGIGAWRTARAAATLGAYDLEVCEVGEAFTETVTAAINLNLACYATLIHSFVNGTRSAAFHSGTFGSGYILHSNSSYAECFTYTGNNITIDGIQIQLGVGQNGSSAAVFNGFNDTMRNCLIYGDGTYGQTGIRFYSVASIFYNNIIRNCQAEGIVMGDYSNQMTKIYNNIVAKCGTGFLGSGSGCYGAYWNNIAIGNTTNWGTTPSNRESAAYNCGVSGNTPWYLGTDTGIKTMVTGDFTDYTNNNYRPASSSAHQVEAGLNVYGGDEKDITDSVRPSYINGTTDKWDCGPFELDRGNGLKPVAVNVVLQNVADGSRYRVYNRTSSAELATGTQSGTGDITIATTYTGAATLEIDIRKASGAPKYLSFETLATLTSSGATVYISQQPDTVAA